MPNLLLTAASWTDGTVSPPAVWDGSKYAFTAAGSITYSGTVAAGDTIAATLVSTSSGDYDAGHHIKVLVNGVDAITWDNSSQSYPTGALDITLAAGDTVEIQALNDGCGYPPQFDMTPTPVAVPTVNCDCNDASGNRTLLSLRQELMVRLGFGAQKSNPPPGMTDLLNSFLVEAQELLYRRYKALRTERFYSWPLTAGVRMYDFADNAEACTKRLDPRKVTWVGVVEGETWRPLICGIPPEAYSFGQGGPPLRYEIRQCIEVWPTPTATEHYLVIKGHFGLEPFAADTDATTIDDRLVFLLALDNAKAHYGRPDAGRALQQMEVMLQNLVAGSHGTRRYLPGKPDAGGIYVQPKPTVPFV